MTSARHDAYLEPAGSARAWNILAGWVCLIFFAPLFVLAYGMARAGGPAALVGRRRTRSDGHRFTAWRFNTRGRHHAGLSRCGRFLHWTRLDVLPHLVNVARGDMVLAELFRQS